MPRDEKNNYYEILDISSNSTPEQIHEGYVKAKNTYSPESAALYSLLTEKECLEILDNIETAYSVLSIPTKRLEYDKAHNIINIFNQGPKGNTHHLSSKPSEEEINFSEASSGKHRKEEDFRITQNDVKISKISAQGRFALQYERNEVFEQEIDNTEQFTGELLKKIREYKNIDIDRMTDLTRISKTYIKQIEGDEFDKLPALAYVRGFVYQYAKCLKLNPDQVANSYINYVKDQKSSK